ncbi:nitrilotriacetate monooxygenase component B-like protein [Rhodotorula diobovata]|uniref:Nitrilotriacetate monooxygenase component B-like protein n=1 Tax=Rhodotorula diobovata TaxID=5288 RepID=A0A5C5FWS9_9BASI|nr:nitrilotriacetate monooxygenase component B-like protein [Rhodotorula diobovata]
MVFYEPGKTDHGLPHDPFKACVVPRPIGWISTLNTDGSANLAPYSQFNNLTFDPPMVMFSSNQKPSDGGRKDSVVNAEREGEFCWSLATYDLREAVNTTAEQVPYGEDEFRLAGLTKEQGNLVRAPMIKESPIKFECKYHSTLRLPGNGPMGSVDVVIGRVVGVHIDPGALTDGLIDVRKTQPIARLGYWQYTVVRETFEMAIPGDPRIRAGLEGSAKQNGSMEVGEWARETGEEEPRGLDERR